MNKFILFIKTKKRLVAIVAFVVVALALFGYNRINYNKEQTVSPFLHLPSIYSTGESDPLEILLSDTNLVQHVVGHWRGQFNICFTPDEKSEMELVFEKSGAVAISDKGLFGKSRVARWHPIGTNAIAIEVKTHSDLAGTIVSLPLSFQNGLLVLMDGAGGVLGAFQMETLPSTQGPNPSATLQSDRSLVEHVVGYWYGKCDDNFITDEKSEMDLSFEKSGAVTISDGHSKRRRTRWYIVSTNVISIEFESHGDAGGKLMDFRFSYQDGTMVLMPGEGHALLRSGYSQNGQFGTMKADVMTSRVEFRKR